MKVMVAAASKHDGTWGIAEAIGRVLSSRGHTVELDRLHPDENPPEASGFDAFVIGSGVYAGRWLAPARSFVASCQPALAGRPVWLFSSGPVGIVPRPAAGDAVDASAYVEQTGAREHRLFGGRIDRSHLGFGERALVGALGVEDGDNRDFDDIRAWAAAIADDLARLSPAGAGTHA